MSKEFEFIKECGAFFVLTEHDGVPAGRPFGAIMEIGEKWYITTADHKAVYGQLKGNENVQLLALKPGTRSWVRITGKAREIDDIALKDKMLIECPRLQKYHSSGSEPHFNVFEIEISNKEMYE